MDDTKLLEIAEKEFAAAVDESKKARAERDAAQERFKRAVELTQAWWAILDQKRKATGTVAVTMPPREVFESAEPKPRWQEISEGMQRYGCWPDDDHEGPMSQTEFVRSTLKAAGVAGATPAQIRAHAEHLGLPTTENFPHGILGKLKARREVKNIGGKYVIFNREPSKGA